MPTNQHKTSLALYAGENPRIDPWDETCPPLCVRDVYDAQAHKLCLLTGDFADIRNYPPHSYAGIVVLTT